LMLWKNIYTNNIDQPFIEMHQQAS